MRGTLLKAAAAGLLVFAGSAAAQTTIVRWDAIVGVRTPNLPAQQFTVAGIPAGCCVWSEGGRVTLNLMTGQVAIDARDVSRAFASGPAAMGAPVGPGRERKGMFVCDARGIFGQTTVVGTESFTLDDNGSVNYRGFISVPLACREHPEETVFLLGTLGPNPAPDDLPAAYFAFGAARKLLGR